MQFPCKLGRSFRLAGIEVCATSFRNCVRRIFAVGSSRRNDSLSIRRNEVFNVRELQEWVVLEIEAYSREEN
jgi:hypothetical protein